MILTLTNLSPLLEQFKGDGLMVGCCVDVSNTPGLSARWSAPFKAKAAQIKRMLADDERAWRQFERNFRAVSRAMESAGARHARGMAVFAALQRGYLQTYPLEEPVENELVVHEAPDLVPLLKAIYRQREYLVVHADTHQARLDEATPTDPQSPLRSTRCMENCSTHAPSWARSEICFHD